MSKAWQTGNFQTKAYLTSPARLSPLHVLGFDGSSFFGFYKVSAPAIIRINRGWFEQIFGRWYNLVDCSGGRSITASILKVGLEYSATNVATYLFGRFTVLIFLPMDLDLNHGRFGSVHFVGLAIAPTG